MKPDIRNVIHLLVAAWKTLQIDQRRPASERGASFRRYVGTSRSCWVTEWAIEALKSVLTSSPSCALALMSSCSPLWASLNTPSFLRRLSISCFCSTEMEITGHQCHIIIVALAGRNSEELPAAGRQLCVLPCTSARRRPSLCDRWSPSSATAAELWPPTCCNRTSSWSSHRTAWRREEEEEEREGVYFI